MNDPVYALFLEDPAVPPFASAPKLYLGREDDILAVMQRLETERGYPETVFAVRAFFAGDKSVTHTIASHEYPILSPVQPLDSTAFVLPQTEWSHTNTWDSEYLLRAESIEVTQILVYYKKLYVRCIRACFHELSYRVPPDEWLPIGRTILGHRCVLDIMPEPNRTLRNQLFVVEDIGDDPEEVKTKMRDPNAVMFRHILDEVFGTG